MLRHVLFDMALFADESERENSQKRVLCLLEALVWCNRLYLQQHPDTPLMYQSGIKYVLPEQFEKAQLPEIGIVREFLEKKGASATVLDAFTSLSEMCGSGEHFREIPRIIENGGGDCDNVAAWRVAELRERGIPAKPYITWKRRADGGMTYHVIVRWPDGTSEDPSLLLGMGGASREGDRQLEEEHLGERCAEFLAGLARTRNARTAINGIGAVNSPQNYNQLQYTIPFQTDDALYEDWSPTRPQAYFANPMYKGGLIQQSGPLFNTRIRDYDDREERFDGWRSRRAFAKKRAA
jgi:hypothetical protein